MRRFAPFLLFLTLAAVMAVLLLNQPDRNATAQNSVQRALPALTLQPFDHTTSWNQASLLGHITVINVFASWCAPCAAEMPELIALKKQFPKVKVVGILWNDDPKAIRAFLKRHGNPFDTLWIDAKGESTIALGIRGIPESFVVDTTGTIRYRLSGPMTEQIRGGEISALLTTLQQGNSGGK